MAATGKVCDLFRTCVCLVLECVRKICEFGICIRYDTVCGKKRARHGGALPLLQELFLHDNQMGDQGITAFANSLGKGALPQLDTLLLTDNQIGDAGMSAPSGALVRGAEERPSPVAPGEPDW